MGHDTIVGIDCWKGNIENNLPTHDKVNSEGLNDMILLRSPDPWMSHARFLWGIHRRASLFDVG